MSGRKLAAALGVSPTTLGEWEEDQKTPRAFFQLLMQAMTGIPPEAWLSDDEEEQLAQARGRGHAPTIAPESAGAVSP
jgi:transcriptional regulator with XRE-family HTH domain